MKKNKSYQNSPKNILFILCNVILLTGCSEVPENIKWNEKNPASYIYNLSKDDLREALRSSSNLFRKKHFKLFFKEGHHPIDTLHIFDASGNGNDFYLTTDGFTTKKSHIYRYGDVNLVYSADYHLKLKVIDTNQVSVTVITIGPKVIIGKDFFPSPPHFVRQNKYLKVEPSTIEEYEILSEIGKIVNEEGMPLVKYPSFDK